MMKLKKVDSKGSFVAATSLFDENSVQIFSKQTGEYVATIPVCAIDNFQMPVATNAKQDKPAANPNQLNLF